MRFGILALRLFGSGSLDSNFVGKQAGFSIEPTNYSLFAGSRQQASLPIPGHSWTEGVENPPEMNTFL